MAPPPFRIAHLWGVTASENFRPGSSFHNRNIEQGFSSHLFLAQAIADENPAKPLHIIAFTTGAAQVRAEPRARPGKPMALGVARVIPRELPEVTVALMDLTLPVTRRGIGPLDAPTASVLEELLSPPANTVAALRGPRRYAQTIKPATLLDADLTQPQGAPVQITGGFGGIGLTIAEDPITRHGASITLIARRLLPDRRAWPRHLTTLGPDDPLSRRILALQRLEALGGEVLVITADVCKAEEMRNAKTAAEARFGTIRAVIHAVGVVDDGRLMTRTLAQVTQVLVPKQHGRQVLAGLFPDGRIDLMVLFSSTSTVTGPAGQIDYVAANEYLNAFAKSRRGGKTRVMALNWGVWTGVGMAAEALADRSLRTPVPQVPITAPMFDAATFDAAGNRMFTATFGIDRWVRDGHRLNSGRALIPGTACPEVMAEAMAATGEACPFDIHDLFFFRPLDIGDLDRRDIRATLARTDEGYPFELRAAVSHHGRTGWQLHAQARRLLISETAPGLTWTPSPPACPPPIPAALPSTMARRRPPRPPKITCCMPVPKASAPMKRPEPPPAALPIWWRCIRAKVARKPRSSWWRAGSAMC